jgi:hypothetical protein
MLRAQETFGLRLPGSRSAEKRGSTAVSHLATVLPVRSAVTDNGQVPKPGFAPVPASEPEAPPAWTPARIDLARRLWSKGVAEGEILRAINRLSGARNLSAEAVADLARRLRWPGPHQPRPTMMPATRDGLPSIAERQAAELAETLDIVELPLEDAVAWGKANGVPRQADEPDAALLVRINRARAAFGLPRFRISRREMMK